MPLNLVFRVEMATFGTSRFLYSNGGGGWGGGHTVGYRLHQCLLVTELVSRLDMVRFGRFYQPLRPAR